MCGIAGILSSVVDARGHAAEMAERLRHRGPDNFGIWSDGAQVALAHRRLSILDLSPAGHQPMMAANKRLVIVFNGEIYNHKHLRRMLELDSCAPQWRGHSDTETLLAAMGAWGITRTLQQARGMFAFALWDCENRTLTLARDRVGEKPLYYGMANGYFAFASELKALRSLPGWAPAVDSRSIAAVFRFGYVPAPLSIYQGILKLPPGCVLRVAANGSFGRPEQWWNFQGLVENATENRNSWKDQEAVDALDELLGCAVAEQMVADVPLGALLSGGVDSSTVVALMKARSCLPVRTFTIGFTERDYDEAKNAKKIAGHLGTEHAELNVTAAQALNVIPQLADVYDEPFADASQIPSVLICALTRQHVKVCLSGDGADELFGGYNRYFWASSLWNRIRLLPASARSLLSDAIVAFPASSYNRSADLLGSCLPTRWHIHNPGDKLHKVAAVLASPTREALYRALVSQWKGSLPVRNCTEPVTLVSDEGRWPKLPNFDEKIMAIDSLTYLPDDILVKLDRAAMAAGLETRLPFLDERVIKFAWSLPLPIKIRHGRGKWILRQLLNRYIPASLFERPKQGFGVPLEHWLRGPLRAWAEDLLSPSKLSEDEFLNTKNIRLMWDNLLLGRNVQYALWPVLMYQAWKRRWF